MGVALQNILWDIALETMDGDASDACMGIHFISELFVSCVHPYCL
jgi:hypothetical protein